MTPAMVDNDPKEKKQRKGEKQETRPALRQFETERVCESPGLECHPGRLWSATPGGL
jgi:hypothetical protein